MCIQEMNYKSAAMRICNEASRRLIANKLFKWPFTLNQNFHKNTGDIWRPREIIKNPMYSKIKYSNSNCFAISTTSGFQNDSASIKNVDNGIGLVLYESASREKKEFVPLREGKVMMYVCGVTVYDYSHIGHARAYVSFDVLYRLLRHLGYDVFYTRNFTDIDDKIIKRANEMKQNTEALTAKFIDEFHKDMELLGCLKPTAEPRATQYVPQMISMIQTIIQNGHGYAVDGEVFFDTESLQGYGRLSGRDTEDNRAGERVAIDTRKKNPADFSLWKAAKPDEPSWSSPWGDGRPGWHIECSTMIKELMGPVIDIHGGGCDLLFPHHENELAQSQAAAGPCEKELMMNGVDFVRFWIHNGFVNVNEEKMSKSTGNFFTIRDILQNYHPLSLRWMLLSMQYRQPLNFTHQILEEAEGNIYYLYQTLIDTMNELRISDGMMHSGGDVIKCNLEDDIIKALCDDLNTTVALADIYATLKKINEIIHTKKGKKMKNRLEELSKYSNSLLIVMDLIGLTTKDAAIVIEEMKHLALKRSGLSEIEIEDIIQKRNEARKEKNYAKADSLRLELSGKGIAICDSPLGTTWRPGV